MSIVFIWNFVMLYIFALSLVIDSCIHESTNLFIASIFLGVNVSIFMIIFWSYCCFIICGRVFEEETPRIIPQITRIDVRRQRITEIITELKNLQANDDNYKADHDK